MDLAQLKRAHVLVTGDAMLDRYWFGDAERISPEAPVPVVRVTRTEERLGGAANVARNIATVGASSTLLSVVGNDEAGQSIEKLLRAEGIQPELELDPALKTTVKLRVVARQQQLVRCDFEAMPAEETLKRHLGTFSKLLTTNQALVLSDYGKGGLSHISTMIAEARAVKLPIRVRPLPAPPKWPAPSRYHGATVITPNRAELRQVVGTWTSEASLIERAQNLRQALELDYLLLTRSEEGMTLFGPQGQLTVPAQAREVYDVSGAGDTVIGILAAMLATGMPIEEAVQIANRAGGIVVGKLGTAAVSYEELFG